MPFATTNLKTIGIGGGLRRLIGNWTADVGDAAGTITFAGSMAGEAHVAKNSNSGVPQPIVPTNASLNTTTGITTLTVYHLAGVTGTQGTFDLLVYGG